MRVLDTHGRFFGKLSLIDLSIICCVLSPLPVVYYGYRSFVEPWRLSIDSIDPKTVTAGDGQSVVITGTGFDRESIVQFGGLLPIHPSFLNEAHLGVVVPDDVSPGAQYVRVRNGRGRLVVRENGFRVLWQPKITNIVQRAVQSRHAPPVLEISGRYFEGGCTAWFGGFEVPPSRLEYVNSSRVNITVFAGQLKVGQPAVVRLVNPAGLMTTSTVILGAPPVNPRRDRQLHNPSAPNSTPPVARAEPPRVSLPPIVTPSVTSPQIMLPPPAVLPQKPKPEPVVFLMVCGFPQLTPRQLKEIRPGAVELENGAPIVKVIDKIGKIVPTGASLGAGYGSMGVTWTSKSNLFFAHLLVVGEIAYQDGEIVYMSRGDILRIGTVLNLRVSGEAAVAVVLSDPIPVKRTSLSPRSSE